MYLGRPAVWHYGLAAVRRRAFLAQVMRVSRHHRRGLDDGFCAAGLSPKFGRLLKAGLLPNDGLPPRAGLSPNDGLPLRLVVPNDGLPLRLACHQMMACRRGLACHQMTACRCELACHQMMACRRVLGGLDHRAL